MRFVCKASRKCANVKRRRKKETKYSLFPHRFNAEDYFIVNIDLCGADVRLSLFVNDHSR